MKLAQFINSITPIAEEELHTILSYFKYETHSKGHQLLDVGQICNKLYFMEKGLVRSFYVNEKGKEITIWFFNDEGFLTGVDSFFQQKPSMNTIELLEDSVLYSITYSELNMLFDKYHAMEKFGRLLSLQLLSDVVEKLNEIQFHTAKERYNLMLKKHPKITSRAPLGHIASYLGITQETLSRIRSQF